MTPKANPFLRTNHSSKSEMVGEYATKPPNPYRTPGNGKSCPLEGSQSLSPCERIKWVFVVARDAMASEKLAIKSPPTVESRRRCGHRWRNARTRGEARYKTP